jgi:AcrR family transcriptional regulator
MSDTRERLLEVAARIFAEAGYHGTTTRRIAQEAAVNEITLFRQFGTKDALIREAIVAAGIRRQPRLDFEASDPVAELQRWALAMFYHFYNHRNLVLRLMGDMAGRPEIAPDFCRDAAEDFTQLERYLEAMKARRLVRADLHCQSASGMLVGALLSNAIWRDLHGQLPPPEENVRRYVDLLLDAVAPEREGSGCA